MTTETDYLLSWAASHLKPLVREAGGKVTWEGGRFLIETTQPLSAQAVRQIDRMEEVHRIELLSVNNYVVYPTELFRLEAEFAVAKGLEKLRLIALICNAKTLHLLGVYLLGKRSVLIGKPKTSGDLDIGSVERLLGRGAAKLSADVIGIGYFDTSKKFTSNDCPRVHTPAGVAIQGMGYGTSLYVGVACAAFATLGRACVGSAPESNTYGPRSAAADDWWVQSVHRGLAEEVDLESLDWSKDHGEEESKSSSGVFTPSYPLSKKIEEEIESELESEAESNESDFSVTQIEDIEYSYDYTEGTDFDLEKLDGIAAVLPLENCIDQGLVLWIDPEFRDDARVTRWMEMAYVDHQNRFKRLNPDTDDPKILTLLREILLAGGISDEDLVRWEATHGVGGRGTEFLFSPEERSRSDEEDDYQRIGPERLLSRGQPKPRTFEQMVLPGSLAPNRMRQPADPELRALIEPWLDDDS